MQKKVLVLGGTGVMGVYLVRFLSEYGVSVYVTSRTKHVSDINITYLQGDAKDDNFLKNILADYWDAVIDFMIYSTDEFRKRVDLLLSNTSQYIFISSARVYADSYNPITEESPRLLDVSTDEVYLATDEYALAKAREEDLIRMTGKKNWTIIRPSITYGNARLQLGALEKENWLYRALHGRSIVFSKDIAEKFTTMTAGFDVAEGISAIIGNEAALGETFHIVQEKPLKWEEALAIYLDTIEEKCGKQPNVIMTDVSTCLKREGKRYQVLYGRYFSRKFNNEKIKKFINIEHFENPRTGLKVCLNEFMNCPQFKDIDWILEAMLDCAAGERTPFKEIPTIKERCVYFVYRYKCENILKIYGRIKRNVKKFRGGV